ncbi:MAG: TetR/AcrR family transcriptional regulator [Solirubrobacterales bacterium]
MTSLTRTDSQAQTRRRLIDAGAEVFSRRGYRGAVLDEIAEQAGYTIGAIYSNFSTKHELFLAVLEDHVGGRIEEVARALEQASTSDAAIELSAADTVRHLRDDPTWLPLFIEYWSEAMREPAVRERFAEYQLETRRRLTELIGDWARKNDRQLPLDPDDVAVIIKALTNGIALEQMAAPGTIDDDLLMRALQLLAG